MMSRRLRRLDRRLRRRSLAGALAVLAAALGSSAASQPPAARRLEAPSLSAPGPSGTTWTAALRTGALSARASVRLSRQGWWGRTYTTSTGEGVTVRLSDSYPADDAKGQAWADFFASLLHGRELASLTAYIAPLEEVERLCGGEGVLGCYGGRRLVTTGEAADGVSAAAVATHEYGHHVAANRLNSPWRADEWGTKRWATYAKVCSRAASGTAFPGDEGLHYELNPGEAFAEVYRILNETRAGATTFAWPVVDQSFYPDGAALDRVQEDVLQPWARPSVRTVQGRLSGRSRTSTLALETPLDGEIEITLRLPAGAGYELVLLSSDGRRVLARGLWSSSRTKTLRYEVCGRRSVVVRVTRGSNGGGSFGLRISVP